MTELTDMTHDDPVIAAEYVLGLLEGEELLTARGRVANEPAFAELVNEWEDRLAPMLDEVAPVAPSADVWAGIEARIAEPAPFSGHRAANDGAGPSNVVELSELKDRVRRWKITAGASTFVAALALALPAVVPTAGTKVATLDNDSVLIAAADPLVATVPIGDTGLRLDVTYVPESEQMLIGAIGLTADGVHDHELWLVPEDGSALQSLGVVAPGEVLSRELPKNVAANMGDGVKLVLTREPIGGKPEGLDAGPVVAEGAFNKV